MASTGSKQARWQGLAEDFELDLSQQMSISDGGLCSQVQEAIEEEWQPLKYRHGKVVDPPKFDTREKTIEYYQYVRDLAAEYLEMERAEKDAEDSVAAIGEGPMKKLGNSYYVKFMAGDKEGAKAVAKKAVDAIAVKTKDAMAAKDFNSPKAAMDAFKDAGLEAMQAFTSAVLTAEKVVFDTKHDAMADAKDGDKDDDEKDHEDDDSEDGEEEDDEEDDNALKRADLKRKADEISDDTADAKAAAADTKPFPTDGSYRHLLQKAIANGFQCSVMVYDEQGKSSRAMPHDTWKRMCEQNYV